MSLDLTTPNALVGIIATIGGLEAVALVTAAAAGVLVYRRFKQLLERLENQLASPRVASLDAALKDIKEVFDARAPKRRRAAEPAPTLH
jgi:hypothetical protein